MARPHAVVGTQCRRSWRQPGVARIDRRAARRPQRRRRCGCDDSHRPRGRPRRICARRLCTVICIALHAVAQGSVLAVRHPHRYRMAQRLEVEPRRTAPQRARRPARARRRLRQRLLRLADVRSGRAGDRHRPDDRLLDAVSRYRQVSGWRAPGVRSRAVAGAAGRRSSDRKPSTRCCRWACSTTGAIRPNTFARCKRTCDRVGNWCSKR